MMFSQAAEPSRPTARRHVLVATLVALALTAASCGSDGEQVSATPASDSETGATATGDGTPTTATQETETESTGPKLDPATFVGEATTVGGEAFDLAMLADSNLVLWFWAPW